MPNRCIVGVFFGNIIALLVETLTEARIRVVDRASGNDKHIFGELFVFFSSFKKVNSFVS